MSNVESQLVGFLAGPESLEIVPQFGEKDALES